ncbi:hypothetical protein [Streptomyces sp. NPDC047928]|uniref:DUF7848 domain-containing protein n=1 Tax=unclassified Streptomyces TaxID=2593676 RepID=UPI00371E6917
MIRRAEWTIAPDRSPGAPQAPLRETECTTCHDRSEPDTGQLGPDSWAMTHAARTGHTGFREVVTGFLRVTPAPGNPLHQETAP